MTQIHLLGTRRFAPFFWTQFLGAFNDNLYKNALVVLLTFHTASWTTLTPETLTNLAAGVFILPFFLFSATAGQLADKYDKARLSRLVKLLEIAIIGVAALGFYAHSLEVLLTALFLLGLQSTLFGPVKYAILPQHLSEEELVGGNALVESGTFVSILIGTLAGGLLAGSGLNPGWIAFAALLVAIGGYVASCGISPALAPSPDLRVNFNPVTETWHSMVFARENRTVFLTIIGISWFWLYGALLLAQFPVYALHVLGGNEVLVTLMLSIFTVGIGTGSMLCEKFSGKHVEIGLIPVGILGLTVFGADLAFAGPALPPSGAPLPLGDLLATGACWRVFFDLFAIGAFGGFFVVPLYVVMQSRSEPEHRARIVAANNILNALFMVGGAIAAAALLWLDVSIPQLFGIAALCNALVAFYVCRQVPDDLTRFVLRIVESLRGSTK
ncbi:MFS transporter [Propionivibrio limicola]|uniref:MFS transporter n=1 Tax=Propionivibrio limicola TaxID=167645 RepID=UPI0012922A31|nr:MFS transporter [Propionivibrio limicola]